MLLPIDLFLIVLKIVTAIFPSDIAEVPPHPESVVDTLAPNEIVRVTQVAHLRHDLSVVDICSGGPPSIEISNVFLEPLFCQLLILAVSALSTQVADEHQGRHEQECNQADDKAGVLLPIVVIGGDVSVEKAP